MLERAAGTNPLEFVLRPRNTVLPLGACAKVSPRTALHSPFLEFRVKEQVLHTAWKKTDVHYEGKRIYFDQDHPSEILQNRNVLIMKELRQSESGFRQNCKCFLTAVPKCFLRVRQRQFKHWRRQLHGVWSHSTEAAETSNVRKGWRWLPQACSGLRVHQGEAEGLWTRSPPSDNQVLMSETSLTWARGKC